MDLQTTNPSWRLSLPHVLVATISSFLFGYHVGFVHSPGHTFLQFFFLGIIVSGP